MPNFTIRYRSTRAVLGFGGLWGMGFVWSVSVFWCFGYAVNADKRLVVWYAVIIGWVGVDLNVS